MNVTELARRLQLPTQQLLDELPGLGFDIGKRAIKIDDRVAQKVIMTYRSKLSQKKTVGPYKIIERGRETTVAVKTKEVILPNQLTVKEFSERLNLPVANIIGELVKNGIMAALHQRIDFETAAIVAEDLGYNVTRSDGNQAEEKERGEQQQAQLLEILTSREQGHEKLETRPPVVVVMGHVDHGKTTLLDALRETNVAGGEAGGITQHIGAYQVTIHDRLLTFLDTPGHEAFSAMRSRGGQLADLAIIVVAADDGLKPQTLEAIEIAQKENLPFLVAINKIDKPEANIEKTKQMLAEINLLPEDWGGKTICVAISAKAKENLQTLLENLLILADLEELKTLATGPAVGTVIESRVDKNAGILATVLVQSGQLKVGDNFVVSNAVGLVRSMIDWRGQKIDTAGPSTPVRILGFKKAPLVGDFFKVVASEELVQARRASKKTTKAAPHNVGAMTSAVEINKTDSAEAEGEVINFPIILRNDVLGSSEAIVAALQKIQPAGLKIKILRTSLGNITEADISEAASAGAVIYGFHIIANPEIVELARSHKVKVKVFKIIYDLINDVKQELQLILKPELVRTYLGQVQVLAIFRDENKRKVVGARVLGGKIERGDKIKLKVLRNGAEIGWGRLGELQSGRESVREVVQGQETGLEFLGPTKILVGDVVEVYAEEIKQRQI